MRLNLVTTFVGLGILICGTNASAQLADLQPGQNFPSFVSTFGGGHSENLDVGDADNDGDMDVIIANGGDSGAQANRIYINQGGLQGGTVGSFLDQTGARFAGVPNDTSRDIEFVDIDNDDDLDIYVSNRGTAGTGEVSRFYVNQGGLQGGTIGFFAEDTDNRWGDLLSVSSASEVNPDDGHGAWRDWSCDCDFGDLDDDGDLDLFHSSYGPTIDGSEPSRIFLNNGSGQFDELFPWANAGADIRTHCMDLDLADFDGDYDLDVFMSSRDSQARVYHNNCYGPLSDSPFNDITQAALINQGATQSGATNNYEAEYADLDQDGDFDVWIKNYNGNLDRIMRNNGPSAGGFTFTQVNSRIKGDPNVDENEIDFLDFDGDGDLDAYSANFLGTNWLYAGSQAQNGNPDFHRVGTSSGGSLYPHTELGSQNSGQSLDGTCADIDNDGDVDILRADDAGQQNRLGKNTLGIPDTHAPTIHQFTDQCDKPLSTNTIIHAQVRDNHNYYQIAYYDTDVVYKVNGGSEQRVDLRSQMGQQFRGSIPPQNGTVQYWIEVTDLAGNTGISPTRSYLQSGTVYTNLGSGLAGGGGTPLLGGTGSWEPDTGITIDLTNAASSAIAVIFVGFTNNPTPAFGGNLIPVPWQLQVVLLTNGSGEAHLPYTVSKRIPCGLDVYLQTAVEDGGALGGVALSNALQIRTSGAGVD